MSGALLGSALIASLPVSASIMFSPGNHPVTDFGWASGSLALANLETRVGYWEGPPFGGGEYHFLYRGDNTAFDAALKKFAAIHAPSLELVVHNGPGSDQFLAMTNAADPNPDGRVDWSFTVWVPANWKNLYNNPKVTFNTNDPNYGKPLPPPRLDVFVGADGLNWSKVILPDNVHVDDRRALAASGLRTIDGLYFTSPTNTGRSAKNDNGDTVWVGKKADLQILSANIYSQNNANTSFTVNLNTSDCNVDPRELALFIGNHAYVPNGWGSNHGRNNSMQFVIKGEGEAKAAAKSLSVDCALRANPGYKYLAQFTPTKEEFRTNDPVIVQLEIKSLDDRAFAFQRGGQQRGARDNQYGFRAMFNNTKPVPDVGEPANFGGMWGLETVEPGQTFEAKVDLRKWFAFDKPGTYYIHGFYAMAFYPAAKKSESSMPWNLIWSDYASADFQVVIK
jgi:hypothetical protein